MAGRKLGRGLKYLLSDGVGAKEATEAGEETDLETGASLSELEAGSERSLIQVDPEVLIPNPYQPRRHFDEEELEDLAASLKKNGLLQPIVARRNGKRFELIAGERRLRAAKKAGLLRVPVLIRQVDDKELRLLALVENLQRSDLNPIEKALAFQELKQRAGLTHEELATELGLKRSSVSNYLRLLELPNAVQEKVSSGQLSMGHARAILAAPAEQRARLGSIVTKDALSVRATEELASRGLDVPAHAIGGEEETRAKPVKKKGGKAAWAIEMEDQLKLALGCKVSVSFRSGKGRMTLEIGSREEFDRVYEQLLDSSGA